jgi:hypothetical protein
MSTKRHGQGSQLRLAGRISAGFQDSLGAGWDCYKAVPEVARYSPESPVPRHLQELEGTGTRMFWVTGR